MTDTGGPAFPHVNVPRPDLGEGMTQLFTDGGMSLRDYFAGQAVIGVCDLIAQDMHQPASGGVQGPEFIAHSAYEIADAMLKARK